MNEWTVVTVIAALVALFTAVCAPTIKAIKERAKSDQDTIAAMTELTVTIRNLSDKISNLETNNSESHDKLWQHNNDQDEKINKHELELMNHELRIESIEKGSKGNE